ncbi:putative receptor-like protein kinase At3g47110 [Humulus lupulus]|uniref:putative receptor-like protein kinase At3g47110 n=1 Tax=Humulus lupulus TaxID=3486 RepID=UPI002B40E071|nr:putative receptor-like protein kinase At3g47110 [Humulus lupulus]
MPCSSAFVCEKYNDCQMLLKFKKGITSDPHGNLQAWNEANPFCNWTGVTCHQHLKNRVTALELVDMGLQGSLSPFLSNLSLITKLQLHTNRFHGEVPSSFGDLSELSHLNLSYNNLQGDIPASLQGCHSLKLMDLSNNNLSRVILQEIGSLKNLTCLALANNSLTGSIPSFLSNLTKLTTLELSFNSFIGKIPPELGALKKLEIMYLHVNYLEGSIPPEISNCTALLEISLIQDGLSGEIPPELGSKLQNLQKLYLSINKFTGKIPVNLSNLSQLILLDLSINKLLGEVPPELGRLKNLENLYLHSNDLVSGSDNSSLSFLTALTNCSRLKKLHLGSCSFAGRLPDSVGGLSKELYYFNLNRNRITGYIPDIIGNLRSLVNLNLSGNFLTGKIPAGLGRFGQLQRLNLARNKIMGAIPDEMGHMLNLGSLDLGDNLISGSIPPSFGNLSQLRYLYLSHNNLSGEFSIELTQCSLLMLLDLSYNHFKGYVPLQISYFSGLSLSLNLSNNNFEGHIPETIGKLISVQEIDFSNNNFTGVIPSSIGGCIALEYLNFSNNMLQGSIPESMKEITYLGVLDLSHNQLNGTIPSWIGNERVIKTLNLSYNRLSGEVPKNGSFDNFTRNSFVGNVGLCGGSTQMGLPTCKVQHQKDKTKKRVLFYVISSVTLSLLVLLVGFVTRYFLFKIRDGKQHYTVTSYFSSIHGTSTYTQRELESATGGFNEANLLGQGSFGSVYKAVIDQGKTTVAVKVSHEESSQSYKSLQRECEILSKIKHRNLIRIIGSTWTSQFKALVLEFMPNGNLEQHLYPNRLEEEDPCKLTLEERLSIAIDIASGLEYLQDGCPTQIVHCDLKPQNVLLDNDMVAHIADFGIGKLLLDKPNGEASTAGFLRGSIGYIPPEYGQGIEVSVKGDVYSFGVILLEMISRKRPTSSLFQDGLDLRKWILSCCPNNISDIIDITLKKQATIEGLVGSVERLEECCSSLLHVALSCIEDNPHQ